MNFSNLNFYTLLLFLLLSILVIILFVYFLYKKKNFGKIFKLRNQKKYFFIKYIFLILSFVVLIFFIFEPKIYKNENNQKIGIPIVFALDVSKSMNVLDVYDGKKNITRLDFAKKNISNFIQKNPNNNYSLIIFAGEAVGVLPLTNEIDIFLTMLENVDYKNLNEQGTNFSRAIEQSNNRLESTQNESGAIVLLSDGGDETTQNLENLYNKNYNYFFGGIGSESGGEIIIGKDNFGRYNYQTYNGEVVISKLNQNNLKNISANFSGEYEKINNINDINNFSDNLKNIEQEFFENEEKILYNFSRDLTIISFIFFVIYLFLYFFEHKIYFLNKKND